MADVRKEEATKTRCQEKSKDGLSYQIILAEPVAVTPPKQHSSSRNKLSVENIEEKLKAAEERRLSLVADRVALLAARMTKIKEALKRRVEEANNLILQKREALQREMDAHVEKRESIINYMKSTLKEHRESVEKARMSRKTQINKLRNRVEENRKTITAERNEINKRMIDRLKEHNEHVQRVRAGMIAKMNQLVEYESQSKLELAQTRREQLKQEQLEKLRSHERRAEMVRQNKRRLSIAKDAQQTDSSC